MNKIIKKLVLMIVLLVNTLIAQTVTVSTGEWEPWVSAHLKQKGVAMDIVTKVLKSQNIDTEISFYSWKKSYHLAKSGKFDATAVWFKNKEREKLFDFSNEIFSTKDVLIYKKGKKIKFDSIDDLKNYKIAVTRGYSYGQEIDDMIKSKQIKTKIVNSDLSALKQVLKRNNFDIFICAKSVAKSLIADNFKKDEDKQFEFHPKPTISNPLYFLVSKKSKNKEQILKAFNKGLAEFKSKGLIKKMINDSYSSKYK